MISYAAPSATSRAAKAVAFSKTAAGVLAAVVLAPIAALIFSLGCIVIFLAVLMEEDDA